MAHRFRRHQSPVSSARSMQRLRWRRKPPKKRQRAGIGFARAIAREPRARNLAPRSVIRRSLYYWRTGERRPDTSSSIPARLASIARGALFEARDSGRRTPLDEEDLQQRDQRPASRVRLRLRGPPRTAQPGGGPEERAHRHRPPIDPFSIQDANAERGESAGGGHRSRSHQDCRGPACRALSPRAGGAGAATALTRNAPTPGAHRSRSPLLPIKWNTDPPSACGTSPLVSHPEAPGDSRERTPEPDRRTCIAVY